MVQKNGSAFPLLWKKANLVFESCFQVDLNYLTKPRNADHEEDYLVEFFFLSYLL